MRQVLIKQGQAVVEDVPAPRLEPGTILVRSAYSCISMGTERSGVRASGMPLWRRALQRPESIKRGLQIATSQGLARALTLATARLSSAQPIGYSAAGLVLEVGEGVDDLRLGEPVACAGAEFAYHAEIIRVPRNLVVPVPQDLDLRAASTVALGAIALHGVRRAQPTLGETFVVVGLGVLGQLTAQVLRANGCHVIGTDPDRSRIHLAQSLGMEIGISPDEANLIEHVFRLTAGVGADGVIITAATPSHTVVSTGFQMCRKKGRVVVVGDVGLHLRRADFYHKELDFFISTSTGPGRYDRAYEEQGLDYPVAYVRWTENRNMAEYVRLLSEGKVKVDPLVEAVYPVEQAPVVFETIKRDAPVPLLVLLAYAPSEPNAFARRVTNLTARRGGTNRIRIALVGAGEFARTTHLPNLANLSDYYHLQAVVSRTGHNAASVAKSFGAAYATTDYDHALNDPEVDAILIATRHHLHASMVLQALHAGKHVLVEKPLALTREELVRIQAFYAQADSTARPLPVLMTGFNRRFSRYARRIYELLQARSNPMILNYRVNAGYIPLDHWIHGPEGGGRNVGEACHMYDLFTYFTTSRVKIVTAEHIRPAAKYYSPRDNFVATITFADGSVATLTYTAMGTTGYSKEVLEVFVEGKVIVLDDFKRLAIYGTRENGLQSRIPDKGLTDELKAFARVIQHGGDWPISLWDQVQATEIALQVEGLLEAARPLPRDECPHE